MKKKKRMRMGSQSVDLNDRHRLGATPAFLFAPSRCPFLSIILTLVNLLSAPPLFTRILQYPLTWFMSTFDKHTLTPIRVPFLLQTGIPSDLYGK